MGETEEGIKRLADTILKSGLATNPTEAMEKAKASFGAEQILKKLQKNAPELKETKSVSELYTEAVISKTNEVSKIEPNENLKNKEVNVSKEDIQINDIIDLDEESEAEALKEEE
jgi:hypothetical protein